MRCDRNSDEKFDEIYGREAEEEIRSDEEEERRWNYRSLPNYQYRMF